MTEDRLLPCPVAHDEGLIRALPLHCKPWPAEHLDVKLSRPEAEDLLVDHLQEAEFEIMCGPRQPSGIGPCARWQPLESGHSECGNRERLQFPPPLGPVAIVEEDPSFKGALESACRTSVDLERMASKQAVTRVM